MKTTSIRALILGSFLVLEAQAELPRQLPGEPVSGTRHGEFSVHEAPLSSADSAQAKVYDNFSLNQPYILTYLMWSGIYAEPIPSTPQTIDFLIEFWANTGTSAVGPGGAPDISQAVASFILANSTVGVTPGFSGEIQRLTPRLGSHVSEAVASSPTVAGGGPAVDYQAVIPPTYLPAGDYWVSIQAVQAFDSPVEIDPEWQWHFNSQLQADGYYRADLTTNPAAGLLGEFQNSEAAGDMAFSLFGMHPGTFHEAATSSTPTTINAGSSKLISRNGGLNDAGYPAGTYTHFLLTADWEADSGTPTRDQLALSINTLAGVSASSAVIYPFNTSVDGRVYFVGRFVSPYQPQHNGFLQTNFIETSTNGSITLRNTKFQLAAYGSSPVDIEDILTARDDFHSSSIFSGEVEWNRIPHPGGPLSIDTIGSQFDTEIGLYTSAGILIETNDDAVGLLSKLEYADLPADTYYVASAGFNSEFSEGFYVHSVRISPSVILNTNAIVPPIDELCIPVKSGSGAYTLICL